MTYYYRKNSFKKEDTKVFFLFNIIFLIVIILSAIFGIFQTNKIAEYSFILKSLQEQINQIETTNQMIEIKANSFQSMNTLASFLDRKSMVEVSKIDFVIPLESTIAAR